MASIALDPWTDIVEVGWPNAPKYLKLPWQDLYMICQGTNYTDEACFGSGPGLNAALRYLTIESDDFIGDWAEAIYGAGNRVWSETDFGNLPSDRLGVTNDTLAINEYGATPSPGYTRPGYGPIRNDIRAMTVKADPLTPFVSVQTGFDKDDGGVEWRGFGNARVLAQGQTGDIATFSFGRFQYAGGPRTGAENVRRWISRLGEPERWTNSRGSTFVVQRWKNAHNGDLDVVANPIPSEGNGKFKSGSPTFLWKGLAIDEVLPYFVGIVGSGESFWAGFSHVVPDAGPGKDDVQEYLNSDVAPTIAEGPVDLSGMRLRLRKKEYAYLGHYADKPSSGLTLLFQRQDPA